MASATETDKLAHLRAHQVTTEAELREMLGSPSELVQQKTSNVLTPLIQDFITASPYFMIATSASDGTCDVSPKGDPPGSVRVLDEQTLAIPDRLGNKLIDGHRNLVTNGHVGLIFMIPGVDETLRVNGRCFLTKEPELLESLAQRGRAPKLAMVVEVEEVFMHCARSYLRSGLWKPETWPDADTIPTLNAIICEQLDQPAPDESTGKRNEGYRSTLY